MAWIKLRHGLEDDPAVTKIVRILSVPKRTIIGHLVRLWCWADETTQDGVVRGVDGDWVDEYLGAPGFAMAMVAAGWLTIDSESISFPNFQRHNGLSAKRRLVDAARKADDRMSEKCPPQNGQNSDQRRGEKNIYPPTPLKGGTPSTRRRTRQAIAPQDDPTLSLAERAKHYRPD